MKATEVTADWQKVMAAYCQVYGVIHFTSPAGGLTACTPGDQLRAKRSVTSMAKLYLLLLGYEPISDRVLVVRLKAKSRHITLIQVHGP